MKRKIIKIDETLCNGCGLCADACHEEAIQIVDGKAKLIRDDYCDGLGDCLPSCPLEAISFEEKDTLPYDLQAVLLKKQKPSLTKSDSQYSYSVVSQSELQQWPIQIKLLPIQAPYFQHADLLIAADCCAYAYADFHRTFMNNHTTIIGCPKLDMVDYSEKLSSIFLMNDIRSILVLRMEVPCCKGIELAVLKALKASGKQIDCKIITISRTGQII